MNYPVWDVAFGAGLLVAIVSVVHVFVSHFAVGGGIFLVISEKHAYKTGNEKFLQWIKKQSKFFMLVTIVWGAVTGVGIWVTVSLASPSGVSSLIHSFVWGWAIEWITFFLEISASLLYYYGWEKLDRKTHLWFGWIYFWAAFGSMVIINGIITFMLTPGAWLQNHNFWSGVLNPTYLPSLLIRFSFSLALAGLYALITASRMKDETVKKEAVKWSLRWAIPSMVFLPVFAVYYVGQIPTEVFANTRGFISSATEYASLISVFAIITFLLALLVLFKPEKLKLSFALIILAFAFLTMWSFEFIRESIRKPYIIYGYMYGNSVYKTASKRDGGFSPEKINQKGILNSSHWISYNKITTDNEKEVGKEIFRAECNTCHTIDSYRGLKGLLQKRNLTKENLYQFLSGLNLMRNKVMPPFMGKDSERLALTTFLYSLYRHENNPANFDGKYVFDKYCSACHQYKADDPLFVALEGNTRDDVIDIVSSLPDMNDLMPDLKLSDKEKEAFARWAIKQFNQNK